MELSWPPDGSKSLQDGFKLSLFWLSTTQAAIATPLLQAPTACRRTFGQDPLFQVPASVSGMGMPVPTSPSRQGCRPFSREFSTTLPPGGGHTETHYRGWVCVTKKGSPPKPPGSAPSGPRWPKMAQDGPRWVQDAFKMAQDGLKMALRWPKMACLANNSNSSNDNMGSRWPQDAPRWPQDGPKMAPRWLKMAQDGSIRGPSAGS